MVEIFQAQLTVSQNTSSADEIVFALCKQGILAPEVLVD